MGPKAIHLKRGNQNAYITVDQLFDAAFGSTPREYMRKSLLGWRPLTPESMLPIFDAPIRASKGRLPLPAPTPGVKVYETDELIVVEVELPDIEQDSLYIEISGDLLIIRGNRVPVAAKRQSRSQGKSGGKIHRYVQLPVITKPGEVWARLEGDTVRVTIRKQYAK